MSSQTEDQVRVRAQAELELRQRRDFSRFAMDPVRFAHQVLDIPMLTQEQQDILVSLRDRSETNVQAAHSVGKSFIAAIAVLWWVFAVQGLAITTAPTRNQVREILWSEIRKMYNRHKHKLGGDSGQLFLRRSEDARAYGFTAQNYDSNAFQGRHAEKLLLIQDESCGISDEIDDGFSSCLTGSMNRGLRIGNPIQTDTPFERACSKNHVRIPVWSHPNVAWAYELHADGIHRLKADVAEKILKPESDRLDDPVLPQDQWPPELPRDAIAGATSISWIEKVRVKKGEGTDFWMSRVEGLFPVDSTASIIPRSWFMAARARYDLDPEYWDTLAAKFPWRHGLDVGDGGDNHALSSWRGPVLYAVRKEETKGDDEDISRAADIGFNALKKRPGSVGVDKIGVGSGALSELRRTLAANDMDSDQAFGINFGSKDYEGYELDEDFTPENLKALLYWNLREDMRRKVVAIAPLGEHEDELMGDWAGTYYEETSKGTKVEDKKLTRKRLHRSPDLGDAAVYGHPNPPERGPWSVSEEAAWGF